VLILTSILQVFVMILRIDKEGNTSIIIAV